jgi:hypothetical protein
VRKEKVFLTVLLAGMIGFLAGCWVVVAGAGAAGTVAYLKGDLEAVEPSNLDAVYAATAKALEQLGLYPIEDRKDALSALISTRDAQDEKITIRLRRTTSETTKISIRVGIFGNETKSRLIYQQIHDNLRQ